MIKFFGEIYFVVGIFLFVVWLFPKGREWLRKTMKLLIDEFIEDIKAITGNKK